MNTEIKTLMETSPIEVETKLMIENKLLPFLEEAERIGANCRSIVVTDALQTELMAEAKEKRLALRKARTGAEKVKKALKADALAYGKVVQGVYNIIEGVTKPIELHLEQQEKFVEIQKQKQADELNHKRHLELEPFAEFAPSIYLGNTTEEEFQSILSGAKLQFEAKVKAEEEAAAKAKAEAEEAARLRAENEKLKAEQAAAQKAAEQAENDRKALDAERKALEVEKSRVQTPASPAASGMLDQLKYTLNTNTRPETAAEAFKFDLACDYIKKAVSILEGV